MTNFARHAALVAALSTSTAAYAGTLTVIAPPSGLGIASVAALGINNAGWTSGSVLYTDPARAGDGFLRAPDGTYSIFSGGPGLFTQGRAVSNSNDVIGYTSDASGFTGEFRRAADGSFTFLTNPSTGARLLGIAQGVNDSGGIVGNYPVTVPGFGTPRNHGFLLSGGALTDIAYPGQPGYSISARGIANDGTIVGFSGRTGQAFVRSSAGAFTFITRPEATNYTVLTSINNLGIAMGGYDDAAANGHAFQYNTHTGIFTDVVIPGATSVQTFGINDSGQYTVSSDVGSFIYTPGGPSAPDGSNVFLPVDDGSAPDGVADFNFGVVAGQTYYIDPSFARGFEYLSGANVDFASVTLPVGVAPGDSYTLALWNGTSYHYAGTIAAGVAYNFAGAVDRFRIYGIPAGAGIDAANPGGFVTGVTFSGPGQFNGQQISLVPEPANWALMIGGFGLAGMAARRRKARTAIA
ncbi:hypothetical protein SPAN111604_04865 [Sphingomonas antarctica]|uniref:PEPxxWA-CTERM sorting domain-containing protein n=1 Tax=Sphingomonas antarctica TaxID=2040274 RepID=UPI0039E97BF7